MTESTSHDPLDQRPGVTEPQPDKTQPDVASLPDMEVERPNRFADRQADDQDAAQRQALSDAMQQD